MSAADLPDLSSVPPDLVVPPMMDDSPAPARRVTFATPGWENTAVRSALYLPPEWTSQSRLPVLVELPGNGGYRNAYGDASDGSVEGCMLGYGISGGHGFIWVSAPLVEAGADGEKRNAVQWWGDVEETKRHLTALVQEVCAHWGGDTSRVILCGFSRGSIGCNYIGLHDDQIARLWRAFVCHSHYDGVNVKWPYPEAGRASALGRLQRLGARPQWISHESSVDHIRAYLDQTGVSGQWTLAPLPFRNHNASWVLRPLPERGQLRTWLSNVLRDPAPATRE